jgi:hypothetical protein
MKGRAVITKSLLPIKLPIAALPLLRREDPLAALTTKRGADHVEVRGTGGELFEISTKNSAKRSEILSSQRKTPT